MEFACAFVYVPPSLSQKERPNPNAIKRSGGHYIKKNVELQNQALLFKKSDVTFVYQLAYLYVFFSPLPQVAKIGTQTVQ